MGMATGVAGFNSRPSDAASRIGWPLRKRAQVAARQGRPVAPDDLQADGERRIIARESRGHGNRRMARDGDVVAALHPVEVILHFDAGDRAGPLLDDRVGWKLIDGTEQEVVALEKAAHAVKELGAQRLGPGDLLGGKRQTLLDVPDHRVLEQVTVLAIDRAVVQQEGERTQGLETIPSRPRNRARLPPQRSPARQRPSSAVREPWSRAGPSAGRRDRGSRRSELS